jgi:hypothetical protein
MVKMLQNTITALAQLVLPELRVHADACQECKAIAFTPCFDSCLNTCVLNGGTTQQCVAQCVPQCREVADITCSVECRQ